ncbi:MAG: hypothetical protein N3A62_10980 [Thermodesulfovibrionales bacterium]|nr:hypothetical protein [Thermodesulfovibrionales bacterium]
MAKVPVTNLKAGMKLIKPVVNEAGMVMLGEGTVLTDQMINKINNMNIAAVFVEGSQQRTKSKEETIKEIEERFSKSADTEQMRLLKRIMLEHVEEIYKEQ